MKTINLYDLYIITDSSSNPIDPDENAFLSKADAKSYMKKNWDNNTIEELGIAVESIAEVLGITEKVGG